MKRQAIDHFYEGGVCSAGTQGRAAQGCAGHPPSARVGSSSITDGTLAWATGRTGSLQPLRRHIMEIDAFPSCHTRAAALAGGTRTRQTPAYGICTLAVVTEAVVDGGRSWRDPSSVDVSSKSHLTRGVPASLLVLEHRCLFDNYNYLLECPFINGSGLGRAH